MESVLPGIVVNADIITIRHLLEMRSGLGNYGKNEEFMTQLEANPLREWKPEELVRVFKLGSGQAGYRFSTTTTPIIFCSA